MRLPQYARLLTTCEQEPINTPGAIQAHGVLLAVRGDDLLISEISTNSGVVFGRHGDLLGKPLKTLFGRQSYVRLMNYVSQNAWDWLQPITLTISEARRGKSPARQRWDIFVHRHEGALILEFEPTLSAADSLHYYRRLGATLGRIHDTHTVLDLCRVAATLVRQLTDFDRVMVYRFDAEWNGEVLAEERREDLSPYPESSPHL